MTIRRFDANPWIEDGEAQVTFEAVPGGTWVLYADHAAALAAMTERAERAEQSNAVLRAECEAWRAWSDDQDTYHNDCASLEEVEAARIATDAAGALKGVQS